MTDILVTRLFKLTDAKGPLKAFASIRLGPITINGCRIVHQDGKKPWVSMPQEEDKKVKEGEPKKYHPIVFIEDKVLMKAVEDAVIAVYEGRASVTTSAAPAQQVTETQPFVTSSWLTITPF
jgi:hypothetical protein